MNAALVSIRDFFQKHSIILPFADLYILNDIYILKWI